MSSRVISSGLLAAAAGAAMLAMTAAPASAFTLSGPSLAPAVASADVDQVYWHRWHHWHRGWGPGWGPGWGWGPHWHRRCWVGPYGGVHCRRWWG